MNQQPDKLFRERLRGYEKPVSGSTWERISGNLRPADVKPWLKVAVAAALLAASAILLSPFTKEENRGKDVAEKPGPIENVTPVAPETTAPPQTASSAKGEKRASAMKKRTKRQMPVAGKPNAFSEKQPDNAFPQKINLTARADTETEGSALNSKTEDATATNDSFPPAKEERVTLIFTAEEVNERYLDKKGMAEATPADKKASSLRKLLDKAYDLKHNQDPIGDLRQKKNDILALNFKTESGRNQNQ